MHLVYNERIKLAATWLSNISAGLAIGGTLLPLLQLAMTGGRVTWIVAGVTSFAFLGSYFLFWAAQRRLRALRED